MLQLLQQSFDGWGWRAGFCSVSSTSLPWNPNTPHWAGPNRTLNPKVKHTLAGMLVFIPPLLHPPAANTARASDSHDKGQVEEQRPNPSWDLTVFHSSLAPRNILMRKCRRANWVKVPILALYMEKTELVIILTQKKYTPNNKLWGHQERDVLTQ